PGRAPGPAGGQGGAGRAGPPGEPVRAGGRAAPDPVELHQRAQGAAGPGHAVTQVRIVLILTENWTMRPAPDVAGLVQFAIEAERAGLDAVMVSEHVVLGPSADDREGPGHAGPAEQRTARGPAHGELAPGRVRRARR